MDPLNLTNMTGPNFETLCQTVSRIVYAPGLWIMLILDFLIGSSAIVLNLLLFCAVWNVTLFHLNLRLLMAHLSMVFISFTASCFWKASTLLHAFINQTPCELIIESYRCKLLEIPTSWNSQAFLYACASISLERLYCTLRYDKPYYGFQWLGIALMLCCYIVPVQNFFRSISLASGYVPVCENLL